MAEGFAILGIVASITQLVDFGFKVLYRLDEFQTNLDEVPESFRHIKAELPLMLDTLKRTRGDIDAGYLAEQTKSALLPVVEGCREQIKLLDDVLVKILPTASDSWRKKRKKAISSLYNEGKVDKIASTLQRYVQTLTYYHAAASSTLQPLTDEKLVELRRWLSAPDPSENYHKALKQRQANTGVWLLESNVYSEWKTDPASFLWLYGIPGCGKTILSSTVIQDVLQYCDDDPGKAVAYFYFDFNDSQKQSSELMLRSLVTQFSRHCIKVPTTLESLCSSAMNEGRQPSPDALLTALQQLTKEFPAAYIILDALDECIDRAELLTHLEDMAGWQFENLHVIVTSRKEHDIESFLESFVDERNAVYLQSALVNEDIRAFVRHRLSVDKRFKRWQKNEEVQREVEQTLMEKAHGMFRWAVCQLDALEKCLNRFMVRKFLEELPGTLDETYDRILCGIDKAYSDYALHILIWLAFSARPLRVDEVTEVVAIDVEGDSGFDKDKVLEDTSDIIRICSSLVTIATSEHNLNNNSDEDDWVNDSGEHDSDEGLLTRNVVRLAHYSVKEYLLSERIRQGPAADYSVQSAGSHTFIATSCLGYLQQFQEPDSVDEEIIESSKLADYAARHWISHVRAAEQNEPTMIRRIMEVFSLTDSVYINWIRIRDMNQPWKGADFKRSLQNVPTPLYYASLAGLTEIAWLLINEAGTDLNAQGGYFDNALQAASYNGHKDVVERLLEAGADVNVQGGEYGNALQAASFGGREKLVERLLEAGADVNAQGGWLGNALQAASLADVNAQGGEYGNALQAASLRGHEKVVERLLEAGADVNVQGGWLGNALQAASCSGHEKLVELLLDAGADINAQGGRFGNALQAASCNGHEKLVERLLEAGADVNAQGGWYGNALQAASVVGHKKLVERLLEVGADVNALGGYYGNALQAASFGGREKLVERLLDAGADVNAQGGQYGNALQAASEGGYEKVVKLLLEAGAEERSPPPSPSSSTTSAHST